MPSETPVLLGTEDATGGVALQADGGLRRAIDTSDKLRIINEALINTGNEPVNVADDTSDEWRVASSAFDQWVPILLHRRNWNFATRLQPLNRVMDSNYPGLSDIYAKPADCLYLIDVYRPDVAASMQPLPAYSMSKDNLRLPALDFKIVGDLIHASAPSGATALYTPFPVGSQPWSIGFVAALRLKIEATIYRALNEDMQASAYAEKASEAAMQEAIARCDSEEPRKVAFRSSISEARRRRGRGGYWA